MLTRSDKSDPIVRRLHTLAQQSPDLKPAAMAYAAILPLLRDADLNVGIISLTQKRIHEKIEKGIPLLLGLDLELDIDAVRQLMIKLAAAVEKATTKNKLHKLHLSCLGGNDSAAGRLRTALEERKLDINSLLTRIAVGENATVAYAAESLDLDPGLLRTLAQNALKPALRAWARQLSAIAADNRWNRGICYVCGAPAILGELQDNAQVKHLRCGACGADWQFRRLQCIYCGNEDHESQRYLYEEKKREKMRVEVCDRCRGYLKVISAFFPTPAEMLAVEDLATIHLDYIAQERGYARREIRYCCKSEDL